MDDEEKLVIGRFGEKSFYEGVLRRKGVWIVLGNEEGG